MEREWFKHSQLVQSFVRTLRDCDVELDDDLVRVIREAMADPARSRAADPPWRERTWYPYVDWTHFVGNPDEGEDEG